MSRVLVTGGAGFIGSHLVDELIKAGNQVVVYDNLSSGKLEFLESAISTGNLEFVNGDLLNLESLNDAMKNIDIVYHLAANPDIRLGTSVTDTDLKQGTVATYNVLESMRLNDCKNIAFSSSSVVYGEAKIMPTPEDYGPLFPISLYGASKLGSEGLISAWVGTFGIKAWIFRFANIIGTRGTHGVIFDFIHKLKKDSSRLEVLGNGLQEKSYMEVIDCSRAMIHVVNNFNNDLNYVNLGSSDTCSVSRIAEIVIQSTGFSNVNIEFTGGDRGWAGDVPKAMLDVNKLTESGFNCSFQSDDAVMHTAKSLIEEIGL
ncbi:MAG TPA: NAD-dependent epimerase/dehydratase family protein [Candidatus Poseidoniaceae archaeon]|nr:NAD-dependent epimerase/dehydratase family protein [Candidatus Poseidoniaceae archaeon]